MLAADYWRGVLVMAESVKVRVQWSPEKLANLPSSNTYSTVAKFSEDAATWPSEAWSVVLEFDSPVVAHAASFNATARFLMPTAPIERLKPGCIF